MTKKWSEVIASPEFRALKPEDQEAARAQYFNQVVAPQVPTDQVDAARSQFDAEYGIGGAQVRAPAAAPRSTGQEVARQLGLTVRHAIAGVTALPSMAADVLGAAYNKAADAVAGENNGFRFIPTAQALQGNMSRVGLPAPESATERVVGDVASAMSGTGATAALGKALAGSTSQVAANVGTKLQQGMGAQTTAAASGAAAAGVTRENDGGTGAQIAAGLLGSLAPAGVPAAAREGTRRLLRGGEEGRQRVEDAIKLFDEAAGTVPSLAQATGGRGAAAIESTLAKVPGGAGVISKFAQRQADDMQAAVQKLSDDLAPGASAVNAGEAIQRGVQAFKAGFKEAQAGLYKELGDHLPKDAQISVSRTREALAAMNADIDGAPALSRWFKNAKIQGIEDALLTDIGGPTAVLSRPGMTEKANAFRASLIEEAQTATAGNERHYAKLLAQADSAKEANRLWRLDMHDQARKAKEANDAWRQGLQREANELRERLVAESQAASVANEKHVYKLLAQADEAREANRVWRADLHDQASKAKAANDAWRQELLAEAEKAAARNLERKQLGMTNFEPVQTAKEIKSLPDKFPVMSAKEINALPEPNHYLSPKEIRSMVPPNAVKSAADIEREVAELLSQGATDKFPVMSAKDINALPEPNHYLSPTEIRALVPPNAVKSAEAIEKEVSDFLSREVTGKLPYEALKKLRTLVGNEITDGSLVSDVPRSKWKALYAALSEDLGEAAKAAGPKAEAAWAKANDFTSQHMQRLDELSGIVSRDAPEKVFSAAISGTAEGDTIIKRVMSALPLEERNQVAAAVLQRMGRATAGQQNAMGDAFSPETFLTSLAKMSQPARQTIFGATDAEDLLQRLGKIAKISETRREGGRVFANPSGTAGASAQLMVGSGIGGAAAGALATGNPLPVIAAAAPVLGANIGARLMTSPATLRMAASKTPIPVGMPAVGVGTAARLDNANDLDPSQRAVGQIYETPRGRFVWLGNGWGPVQ